MKFVTEAGQQAFRAAIEAIEGASSAEVVVAVRSRARVWLLQHAIVGVLSAIGVLAYTLFSDRAFELWQILALPIATGLFGALLVEVVPPLYRFLNAPELRREHVVEAAHAMFVTHGIHATRERTGILVYISVREQIVALVGDLGVIQHVGAKQLARWAEALSAELARGPEATAQMLAGLAPALGQALPHRADDINELPDAIVEVRSRVRKLRGSRR